MSVYSMLSSDKTFEKMYLPAIKTHTETQKVKSKQKFKRKFTNITELKLCTLMFNLALLH